jgi:uncharacterized protein YqgV (UPF0045/DUF77 family)
MISCQFALYPLGVDHLTPAIESAIGELRRSGLEPEPGPMSSYVVGGSQAVFDGLRRAFDAACNGGHVVMTITISNACPIE